MRYHNITKCDMLNGVGLRVVLWCSHCEHNCPNCQNPQTHDKDSGIPFELQDKEELFEALSKDYIQGLTLSGGDPLSTLNRNEIAELLKEVKSKFPNKDIWCYTGYTFDECIDFEAIKYIDVLVDGRYIEMLKDNKLKWRGSRGQLIYDVQESLKQDKKVLSEHN